MFPDLNLQSVCYPCAESWLCFCGASNSASGLKRSNNFACNSSTGLWSDQNRSDGMEGGKHCIIAWPKRGQLAGNKNKTRTPDKWCPGVPTPDIPPCPGSLSPSRILPCPLHSTAPPPQSHLATQEAQLQEVASGFFSMSVLPPRYIGRSLLECRSAQKYQVRRSDMLTLWKINLVVSFVYCCCLEFPKPRMLEHCHALNSLYLSILFHVQPLQLVMFRRG